MRRLRDILLMGFLVVGVTSCIYDDEPEISTQNQEELEYITLQISNAAPISSTRADEVAAENVENYIHTVKVWAFGSSTNSENQYPNQFYGYAEKSYGDAVTEDGKFVISIPKVYVESGGKADFYVIANDAAINSASPIQNNIVDRNVLESLIMNQAYDMVHQSSGATYSASVGANGLPMSRVVKQVVLSDLLVDHLENGVSPLNIKLLRAVSRIRFFFARGNGVSDNNTKITGFTIGEDFTPVNEKIFPNEQITYAGANTVFNQPADANISTEFAHNAFSWSGDLSLNDISELDEDVEPAYYVYDDEEGHYLATNEDNYETYVGELAANTTLYNVTYLRETQGTKLTLTIHYTTDNGTTTVNKVVTTDFTVNKEFIRNHEIVIYGYFEGNALYVKPLLSPWDGPHELSYTTGGKFSIGIYADNAIQSYRVYCPDDYEYGSTAFWNNAYVGVLGDLVGEDDEDGREPGMPIYSPLLHLKSAYSNTMKLVSSNPDFGFIVATITESGRSFSAIQDEITITTQTDTQGKLIDVNTYFYVVPKKAYSNETEHFTHVYLVDTTWNMKLPINPSFMPGPANVEIWFYHMESQAAYNDLNEININ